jgi:hypothetical protein
MKINLWQIMSDIDNILLSLSQGLFVYCKYETKFLELMEKILHKSSNLTLEQDKNC